MQRTVSREGINQGRKFWTCPNSESARCGYFEWDDDTGQGTSGLGEGGRQTPNGGGTQSGDCYKVIICCIVLKGNLIRNSGSVVNRDIGQAVSDVVLAIINMLLTINIACPNSAQSYNARTTSGTSHVSTNKPQSSMACFKCGEEGHFSNGMLGSLS